MPKWKTPSTGCRKGHPWEAGKFSLRWDKLRRCQVKVCLICQRARWHRTSKCRRGHRQTPETCGTRMMGGRLVRKCLECEKLRAARGPMMRERCVKRGHPMVGDNVGIWSRGDRTVRFCRRCKHMKDARRKFRRDPELRVNEHNEPWREEYEAAKARALSKVRAA